MISAARRLAPSSSMSRSTWIAALSVPRTWPVPPQCGQVTKLVSASDGRSRWRLISIRPKWLMWPTWMRARSFFSASFRRRSTVALFLRLSMSMKSMTISPARSRSRSWRATSSTASQVGAQRRFLDAALARRAARVDVDRDQRLGLVDHQIAAGAQLHGGRQHRVELGLDLVAGEQRLRSRQSCTFLTWLGISMRMKSRAAFQPSSPSTRISSMSRE